MKKNKILDLLSVYILCAFPVSIVWTSRMYGELWAEISAQQYWSNHLFRTAFVLLQAPFLKLLTLAMMVGLTMGLLRLLVGVILYLLKIRLIDTTSERMNSWFRKTASGLVVVLLLCYGIVLLIPKITKPAGPNVILIGADTLRADHLGCNGYGRDTTPVIDRLAQEGVLFTEAFSHVASTTPEFSTISTSKVPMSHGVLCNTSRGYHLEKRHVTLAELLKNNGYITAAFTSGFSMKKSSGLTQGFDVFNDDFSVERRAAEVNHDVFDWLEQNRDETFFLFVHYFDPHGRYRPPPPYNGLFPYTQKEYDIERIARYQRYRDISDPSFYIAQYDGEIKYMDAQIGLFFKKLDELGLRDDTVIIFTADHGETLDDHKWWFEHGHYVYDEQIHIPLIVWYPKLFGHRTVDTVVTHLDIVPTVLDILGINYSRDIEGRSLMDLIRGGKRNEDWLRSESHHGRPGIRDGDEFAGLRSKHFTVRSKQWKMIRVPKTTGTVFEFYNLQDDPGELNNLIGQHPEIERKFKNELLRFIDEYQHSPYYLEHIQHPTEKEPKLSEEDMEALRSLGYLQ